MYVLYTIRLNEELRLFLSGSDVSESETKDLNGIHLAMDDEIHTHFYITTGWEPAN